MKISAVILAYNLEAYVGEAIESVLGQTRCADEVILVDDGSTDRTVDIAKGYGDRLTLLALGSNQGALRAALAGVKAASGDIVAMLDGDDIWAPNKLEVVEREFAADPALYLLSHDHVRVDEAGRELDLRDETHRNIAAIRRQATSRDDLSHRLAATILEQRGYWLGSAYAFRRSAFDDALFEAQIAGFGEDQLRQTYLDLAIAPFLVLTNSGGRVGYAHDTRFLYRVHGGGSLAGNVSRERAIASARKARTINALIDRILEHNGASAAVRERRALLLEGYDYLCALYSGRRLEAARRFARLAARRTWSPHQLAKEATRLAAVQLLGVERFLRLKQRFG